MEYNILAEGLELKNALVMSSIGYMALVTIVSKHVHVCINICILLNEFLDLYLKKISIILRFEIC